MCYRANVLGVFRDLGGYVGQVLKGSRITDLQVRQPTTFELVINLRPAKSICLTISPALLAYADEVIE